MLTKQQEEWVNSLSDKIITIVPYDTRTERLFAVVKKKIQDVLGGDVVVEHCGASCLGISGQDEIDVSIVVGHDKFGEYVSKLDGVVGSVASWYPDRVRFKVEEEGKKIDLKIIDKDDPGYLRGKIFEEYLRSHPADLERYRILKEECSGQTTKEYYRKKIEFINEIVGKVGCIHYFAYGSNMLQKRIEDRIGHVEDLGMAVLFGYKLCFNKESSSGSGKANIMKDDQSEVLGVVYVLSLDQANLLDQSEKMYHRESLNVKLGDKVIEAHVYIADNDAISEGLQPTAEYRQYLLDGAKEHRFPEGYLDVIINIKTT